MTKDYKAPFKPKFFYGWVLVLVLLLLVSFGMGMGLYLYSLVAGELGQAFDASRMVVMSGSMGMVLVMGLCSPIFGRLLDKNSSDRILIPSAIIMGLGFIVVALSGNIWVAISSYVFLISIGVTALSLLAAATLLSRWFVHHRGLAIGIAALGTQFGGFFYPPLFAAAIEACGWRVATGGIGVLILVLAPILIKFLVIDRPEDIDQKPLRKELRENSSVNDNQDGPASVRLSFWDLLAHRNFVLVVLIAGIGMATNTVMIANLSLFATDIGETVVRGAFLLSFVALLGVGSSPLLGWLSDVINLKTVVAILTVSQALSCLIFSAADSYGLLLVAAFFMGVSGGGVFPVFAALVGHLFDTRIYGQVMGAATLWMSFMTAGSLLLSGWLYDISGSYRVLFLTLLVILIVVLAACMIFIRLPRHPSEKFGSLENQ